MPIRKRVTTSKTSPVENIEEPATTPTTNSRVFSNLLPLLLIVVSFFAGYLFFKVKNLEQQNKAAQNAPAAQQNAGAEYLSVDNLKKYGKDLGLDTNKFNACLDNGDKKSTVDAELAEGSKVEVRGTPGFFINGRFLGGAFPFELFKEIIDKELAGTGSDTCDGYSTDLKQYCDEKGGNSFNPVPKMIDLGQAPSKGPTTARVTMVEFSDFECPFCVRAFPTVQQVLSTYPNDVRLVYKQFPLSNIHPKAQKAAEASLCANDQGKFWDYHDKLFTSAGQ